MYNAIFKCVITIKFTSFKYSSKGFSGLNKTKSPVKSTIFRGDFIQKRYTKHT